jgi:hypothetical protein
MSENLILMRLFIAANGTQTHALLNYLNPGQPVPETRPMAVNPGDRVAWYLQVLNAGNPTPYTLPYQLSFTLPDGITPDSSFFGVPSLSVPAGGTSPFLDVLALPKTIKYAISVPGIGKVLDPEMQTGGGPGHAKGPFIVPAAYTVTWNLDNNSMSYQLNGGAIVAFPNPLPVNVGDTITFTATWAAAPPLPPMQIIFAQDPTHRLWDSPFFFVSDLGNEPAAGPAVPPIGPLTVADNADSSGTLFTWTANAFNFPPSAPFTFQVNH